MGASENKSDGSSKKEIIEVISFAVSPGGYTVGRVAARGFEYLFEKARALRSGATPPPPPNATPDHPPAGPPRPPPALNEKPPRKKAPSSGSPKSPTSTAAAEPPAGPTHVPIPQNATTPSSVAAPKPSSPGRLYTDSPFELVVILTQIPPTELIADIRTEWPEIGEQGARCLIAQYMTECGADASKCWTYNYGNIKSGPKATHQYLKNTFEFVNVPGREPPAAAKARKNPTYLSMADVDRLNAEYEKKYGDWFRKTYPGEPIPKVAFYPATKTISGWDPDLIVEIRPPSSGCRFAAFHTRADGVKFFVNYHKRYTTRKDEHHDKYIPALQEGDVATFNSILSANRYYTSSPKTYLEHLTKHKATLDKQLGAIS